MQTADDTVIVMPFMPARTKILYGITACCIAAAGLFVFIDDRTVLISAGILSFLSAAAAVSTEYWTIDCGSKTLRYSYGLCFFVRNRTFPLQEIECVKREVITVGFFKKKHIKYTASFITGEKKVLAILSAYDAAVAERYWDHVKKNFPVEE